MLSVRIRGHNYRITNETLDRVFGESWRRANVGQLQRRIQEHHDAGGLVVQGQRLRVASRAEEAEQRLRSAEDQDEIIRWGFVYVAAQIAEAVAELRALGETFGFDEAAATAKLSRDPTGDEPDLETRLRRYRAEPSDAFVERLAARLDAARELSSERR